MFNIGIIRGGHDSKRPQGLWKSQCNPAHWPNNLPSDTLLGTCVSVMLKGRDRMFFFIPTPLEVRRERYCQKIVSLPWVSLTFRERKLAAAPVLVTHLYHNCSGLLDFDEVRWTKANIEHVQLLHCQTVGSSSLSLCILTCSLQISKI